MYYGVYRGMITDVSQLHSNGRVRVSVPAVAGDTGQWAPVCYTCNCAWGIQVGKMVAVSYEAGSPDRPIVLGQID